MHSDFLFNSFLRALRPLCVLFPDHRRNLIVVVQVHLGDFFGTLRRLKVCRPLHLKLLLFQLDYLLAEVLPEEIDFILRRLFLFGCIRAQLLFLLQQGYFLRKQL